jgi:hypothetical protein
MALVYREDVGSLGRAVRLDNGRRIVDAYFTRSGVFEYLNPDGSIRREYRPPQEVFSKKSMDSLAMVPFTDLHPPVMVDARNAGHYTVGQVGENIRRDGDKLAGKIAINDGDTLAKMDAGECELSCGYDCDLIMGAGVTPEGEHFDATQTGIIYNHVARVPAGRAGTARARMDERLVHLRVTRADAAVQLLDDSSAALSASPDKTTRTDSTQEKKVMDLTQALAALADANKQNGALTAQLASANERADAAENKRKEHKTARDEMEKKLVAAEADVAAHKTRADQAEQKAKDAEKARTDAADNFSKRVSTRATLIAAAATALGRNDKGEVLDVDGKSTVKLDALDDRIIRVKVVKKLDGHDIPAERSDDAVELAYALAVERASKAGAALAGAREQLVDLRREDALPGAPGPDGGDKEAKARARMDSRRVGGWKTLQTANTSVGAKDDDDKEGK